MPESYLWSRYRELIGLPADCPALSLGEGNTPLLQLVNQPDLDRHDVRLLVKFDGANPTGSFKDRGMCIAVAQARHAGARAVLCASTGNTSAAAAAYAVRAGMRAVVVIPEGKIARGKLAQALVSGAYILQIQGNFDAGMTMVKRLASELPIALVNSVNPLAARGSEKRRLRSRRRARPPARLPLPAGGQRGQHQRPQPRLQAISRIGSHRATTDHGRLPSHRLGVLSSAAHP